MIKTKNFNSHSILWKGQKTITLNSLTQLQPKIISISQKSQILFYCHFGPILLELTR